jgi:hypothetical protein
MPSSSITIMSSPAIMAAGQLQGASGRWKVKKEAAKAAWSMLTVMSADLSSAAHLPIRREIPIDGCTWRS